MKRKYAFLTAACAAAVLAGCHGARILEVMPDGGGGAGGAAGATGGATGTGTSGTTGAGGIAGRGGTTGMGGSAGQGGTGGAGGVLGRGGAGGAGGAASGVGGMACAAQMTPTMFYSGLPPTWTEGLTHRFYWAEHDTPNITIHYAQGDQPVETSHPFKIDASLANSYFDLAASDYYVVADWYLDGRLAVWGPDMGSTMQWMTTLTNPGAVTAIGAVVYYSDDPMGGNPTPGIYAWSYPNINNLRASFTDLGGTSTLGLMLRTTTQKILFSDIRQVYMIDIAPGGTPQMLFPNQRNATIIDIRPARPHTVTGGVIVEVDDPMYYPTGHDYFVDITSPTTPPLDLPVIGSAAAVASCGNDATYAGGGVLFNHHFVYEGQGGVFVIDVAPFGVTEPARLTNEPYRYLEVTGDGDLFGGWVDVNSVSKWQYFRLGRLAP